ncbi:MAG TPA: prolyl oligopeptidase family serine peptidase [Flavobacterium sp.]|uniref:carboxylesterase family protein n=1 Tax=Flavobacterium sp. TaxID=239 RepID=UPI002F3FE4BD
MKLLKSKMCFFMLLIICLANNSKTYSQSSLFSYEKYGTTAGDTLIYRQLIPDYAINSKYPLVIFLHGSGERGSDNEAQLKWGVLNFASDQNMKLHPSIVIAPQCPENMGWNNFSDENNSFQAKPTKPMELLIALIKQTIKKHPVDPNRIYITGLSMGGYGTFDAISRYPDLFAAAVPVCGAGDITKAPLMAHVPMWIFHGALDPAVSPTNSQDMLLALTKAGAHPGFTQYPEVGHFSWIAAYSDPMMMEWLFRQRK